MKLLEKIKKGDYTISNSIWDADPKVYWNLRELKKQELKMDLEAEFNLTNHHMRDHLFKRVTSARISQESLYALYAAVAPCL